MNKVFMGIISSCAALILLTAPNAVQANAKEKSDDIEVRQEMDNTDIYAIPLDEDEEDEEVDEEYLKSLEWKKQPQADNTTAPEAK